MLHIFVCLSLSAGENVNRVSQQCAKFLDLCISLMHHSLWCAGSLLNSLVIFEVPNIKTFDNLQTSNGCILGFCWGILWNTDTLCSFCYRMLKKAFQICQIPQFELEEETSYQQLKLLIWLSRGVISLADYIWFAPNSFK